MLEKLLAAHAAGKLQFFDSWRLSDDGLGASRIIATVVRLLPVFPQLQTCRCTALTDAMCQRPTSKGRKLEIVPDNNSTMARMSAVRAAKLTRFGPARTGAGNQGG